MYDAHHLHFILVKCTGLRILMPRVLMYDKSTGGYHTAYQWYSGLS